MLHLFRFFFKPTDPKKPLKKGKRGEQPKILPRCFPLTLHIITDKGGQTQRHIQRAKTGRFRPPTLSPDLTFGNSLSGPQKRHQAIG